MIRKFSIEWPDDLGPMWMNRDNLLIVLTNMCRFTQFTVMDITGDGCDPQPATGRGKYLFQGSVDYEPVIAARSSEGEQETHNLSVAGSIPAEPTEEGTERK